MEGRRDSQRCVLLQSRWQSRWRKAQEAPTLDMKSSRVAKEIEAAVNVRLSSRSHHLTMCTRNKTLLTPAVGTSILLFGASTSRSAF